MEKTNATAGALRLIVKTLSICVSVLIPTVALAAPSSFSAANALLASTSAPGNAYTAGASVVVTAPTVGDLSALGGSIVSAGSVGGDAILIGGSVSSRASVRGDLRVIGGNIIVTEAVAGDLVAFGASINSDVRPGGSVFVVGANVSLNNGAAGPVTVYGNNVFLGGDFAGDVTVVAGGVVTLGKDTVIQGRLAYESPDMAKIHASASVKGGITYTNASYLPDAGTSRTLAVASVGIFIIVRVLGALILAGLLAGLFPALARTVTERFTGRSWRSVLLTTLLGFAALVATPVLVVLLALTFVGLGLAILVFFAFALLVMTAFMYSGIFLGALAARRFWRRETVLWYDGVLGMLALSLLALVPVVGWPIAALLLAFTTGTLLALFFHVAFPQDGQHQGRTD